jgi:hypothetical protein
MPPIKCYATPTDIRATALRRRRRLPKSLAVVVAAAAIANIIPAFAGTQTLTDDIRFCPTWAEAHERTLASLNNGRPPYPVKWKGCIELKRGTAVEVVKQDDEGTEIIFKGKHWFADQ